MRHSIGLALAGALGALAAPAAHAADAETGREIAVTWCSACHIVGDAGRGADAAPPLAALAGRLTPERLRAFLVEPHGEMPTLSLGTMEIENLIAYIRSLDGR